MGYADTEQVGSGLRQRLYSRAFIIADHDDPTERFVYIVLDTQSGDTAVRYGVLEGLANLGPEYSIYNQNNIALTGTHSHSGPGAWLNYLLPQITSKGFDKQSYQAIVNGTILSIQRAHETLLPGRLTFGSTELLEANINRSPYAYLANPFEERARYAHDVDKGLTMLHFTRASDSTSIGVLTWFAVHGTSMYGNNTLISGDNKGVASYLMESHIAHSESNPSFIAAFSQSNVGDTSPNVLGAFCEGSSSVACNFQDSTCPGGKSTPCHGRGPYPALNDGGTRSCYEIGRRQYEAAHKLYLHLTADARPLTSPTVRSLHTFADFSNLTFPDPHNHSQSLHTCPAALGYSFAAGTTDGPGVFDFTQNDSGAPTANPLWAAVRGFLHEPSDAQKACHYPKPILLDVGEITQPYLWTPNIVDLQLLRVGPLIIIVSPGEATTMSGRRWRDAIHTAATSLLDIADPLVVLGGPANSYTHYIATEPEYVIQRYEGASTLYGPHTLAAYIHATRMLMPYLHHNHHHHHDDNRLQPGPSPPDHRANSLNFISPVLYDTHPPFRPFGHHLTDFDLRSDSNVPIARGARFIAANPRNDLHLEQTYAALEIWEAHEPRIGEATPSADYDRRPGYWKRVMTDADWQLVFRWTRTNQVLGWSEVEVVWEFALDGMEVAPALRGLDLRGRRFRLRYHGDAKQVGGGMQAFEGVGGEFIR